MLAALAARSSRVFTSAANYFRTYAPARRCRTKNERRIVSGARDCNAVAAYFFALAAAKSRSTDARNSLDPAGAGTDPPSNWRKPMYLP